MEGNEDVCVYMLDAHMDSLYKTAVEKGIFRTRKYRKLKRRNSQSAPGSSSNLSLDSSLNSEDGQSQLQSTMTSVAEKRTPASDLQEAGVTTDKTVNANETELITNTGVTSVHHSTDIMCRESVTNNADITFPVGSKPECGSQDKDSPFDAIVKTTNCTGTDSEIDGVVRNRLSQSQLRTDSDNSKHTEETSLIEEENELKMGVSVDSVTDPERNAGEVECEDSDTASVASFCSGVASPQRWKINGKHTEENLLTEEESKTKNIADKMEDGTNGNMPSFAVMVDPEKCEASENQLISTTVDIGRIVCEGEVLKTGKDAVEKELEMALSVDSVTDPERNAGEVECGDSDTASVASFCSGVASPQMRKIPTEKSAATPSVSVGNDSGVKSNPKRKRRASRKLVAAPAKKLKQSTQLNYTGTRANTSVQCKKKPGQNKHKPVRKSTRIEHAQAREKENQKLVSDRCIRRNNKKSGGRCSFDVKITRKEYNKALESKINGHSSSLPCTNVQHKQKSGQKNIYKHAWKRRRVGKATLKEKHNPKTLATNINCTQGENTNTFGQQSSDVELILKQHEKELVSKVDGDPFSLLCLFEKKSSDLALSELDNLIPQSEQRQWSNGHRRYNPLIDSGSTSIFSNHVGGIWKSIIKEN